MNESPLLRVRIAECKIARPPAILKSYGLGSCVAVAIYDPHTRIGGLAHVLLPAWPKTKKRNPDPPANPLKYANLALDHLKQLLLQAGCAADRLEAKIAGGANMFSSLIPPSPAGALKPTIGERNVAAVKDHLKRIGIPLRAEDVGGQEGRTVELDPGTGSLRVITSRGHSRIF